MIRGRDCKSTQRGSSLIEVLIAFLLIGVSALGLIKLQAFLEIKSDYALHSIEALYIAENQLEQFTQRGVSSGSSSYSYDDIFLDSCVINNPCNSSSISGFKTNCSVEPFSYLSGDVSVIDVEVCWLDRQREKRSIKLTTMISKFSEFD